MKEQRTDKAKASKAKLQLMFERNLSSLETKKRLNKSMKERKMDKACDRGVCLSNCFGQTQQTCLKEGALDYVRNHKTVQKIIETTKPK